jgi:hypothetical protein
MLKILIFSFHIICLFIGRAYSNLDTTSLFLFNFPLHFNCSAFPGPLKYDLLNLGTTAYKPTSRNRRHAGDGRDG